MAEVEIRDSTIKLFGKTIALPMKHDESEIKFHKHSEEKISCEELASEKTISEISENPSGKREIPSPKGSKKEEQSETSTFSDNKTLKKSDNKILACPRCNSTDTKFCYYNNYNVSQPRHFCKTCQRYWTAGGITRNVPVGAGRRKNKTSSSSSSSSHFRQFLNFGDESSIKDSNSLEDESTITSQQSMVKNVIPFSPQFHSFNGLHWPYPSMAPPPFNLPVTYYTAPPYWGYPAPPSWTVINPQNSLTSSSVLGKRLRDGKSVKQSNSSVFGSFGEGAKGKEENYRENCTLLQANPAAFSRALKFREIV